MASEGEVPGEGLLERLAAGPVICAEGYLFELERRGYVQAGPYVPEVVLDHPEVVRQLHRDFVHAGSDVVEAFTYYGHREKLKVIGKEELLEPLNRQALALAKEVALDSGCLFAGNICNTNVYEPQDQESHRLVWAAFEEQVAWAAEAGVDFVIAETLGWLGEALIALETIRRAGLPAVITLAVHREPKMREGASIPEACRQLEQAGAAVVGMNCIRGPASMLPLLEEVRAAVSCHVAALPVPYRTTPEQPGFHHFSTRATASRTSACSRPRSTRSPATGTRWPSSPNAPTPWTCATSASAAARGPITCARSPRRSAAIRPPAATRPTCRATRSTAPTPRSRRATGSSRRSCRPGRDRMLPAGRRRSAGLTGPTRGRWSANPGWPDRAMAVRARALTPGRRASARLLPRAHPASRGEDGRNRRLTIRP